MTIVISIRGIGVTRHLGDTIWITAVLTDENGATLTPGSQSVTLRDPNGTIRATDVAPTPIVTGTYESKMVITATAPTGLWSIRWLVTTVIADQETEVYFFVVNPMS